MKNLTMEQIANNLGVSKTTVSRVLSGKGRISASTRERVWSYIQSSNYRTNNVAKGLATKKAYNIGLVIPRSDTASEFYPVHTILDGILEVVNTLDYNLIITVIKEYDVSEIIRLLESDKVDGLILYNSIIGNEAIQYMAQVEVPYVVIGSVLNQDVIHIDYNHRIASRELTKLLLRMGKRRIAFIGGCRRDPVNNSRLAGFYDAFNELNINICRDIIFCESDSMIQIKKILDYLLNTKVDAIVCMTEIICYTVINELSHQLNAFEKDIIVATVNYLKLIQDKQFSVAYIQFDAKELGRVACGSLFDLINKIAVQSQNFTGYEIIIRESS